jgi:hypothetical protein
MARHLQFMKSARARIVGAVAVAGMGVGIALGVAGPADAATPTMNITWTPWDTPQSPGMQMWPVKKGTTVRMICWTGGVWQDGTGKWFRIQSNSYPFTVGYVPANAVSNQTIVGRC